MIKEFKKELSRVSGVDMFNPKYRDIFKKYFPNEVNENETNDNEEERLTEVLGEDVVEETKENEVEETLENEDDTETTLEEVDDTETEEETKEEVEEETTEDNPTEDVKEEIETKEDEEVKSKEDTNTQLLETKVELELVKAGVRDDRLEPARKLFMSEIKGLEDLDKLKELIKQYPEWLKKTRSESKSFGMPLDNMGDGLTAEERKLQTMGIDPRD